MSYIALRFIDLFRPGDSIPAGHYPPEAIAKMVASGKVKQVDEPRTVAVGESVADATDAAEMLPAASRRKATRKT